MRRRDFLQNTLAISAASMPSFSFPREVSSLEDIQKAFEQYNQETDESIAQKDELWRLVRDCFSLNETELNMATVVRGASPSMVKAALVDTYTRMNENRPGGNYVRGQLEKVRSQLAKFVNCEPEELAITRNTTDGVTTVINGIRLNAGDEIVTTSQEHEPFYGAMFQRRAKSFVDINVVPLSSTGLTSEDITNAILQACTSKTKLIHLCHVYLTGHIMPIQSICSFARARGIKVLVDGALAVGHIPVDVKQLGCDFYAGSLHKWAGGPRGTGFFYVQKNLIQDLYPLYGYFNEEHQVVEFDSPDIRKFESIGTHPEAQFYSIIQMLDFINAIGVDRIQARLHYLNQIWSEPIVESSKLQFCVSRAKDQSASLLSFNLSPQASEIPLSLWKNERIILGGAYVNGEFGKPETWDEITLCNTAVFHNKDEMIRFGSLLQKLLK